MKHSTIGVIPARLHSTRLQEKVLRLLGGKPIIQHVWERASKARLLTNVIIATDEQKVSDVCKAFGAQVQMTKTTHASGTDRVAEVAELIDCDVVINIQGDEPFIDPAAIDALADAFNDDSVLMATLCRKETDQDAYRDPNTVKVICDKKGNALYFSRAPIPFYRDNDETFFFYKHIGIYGYRKECLLAFSQTACTHLEKIEKLEQLRVLENGKNIKVIETQYEACGIDTEDDLQRAELKLQSQA